MTISTTLPPRARKAAGALILASALAGTAVAAPPAGAADLPPARGHEEPAGPLPVIHAVNDRGLTGGSTADGVAALADPATGRIRSLGLLPGSFGTIVEDIDEEGRAVGTASGNWAPYSWRAFRWTPSGGMVDLGTLGGIDASATAIGEGGAVTGWSGLAGGGSHAFRWTAGRGMEDLVPLPGDAGSSGTDVGEGGTVIGSSTRTGWGPAGPRWVSQGAVWVPGRAPVELPGLGGDVVQPAAVNAEGEIAGTATTPDGTPHVVRWTRGRRLIDLGVVGPDVQVVGLTDAGMVVGHRRVTTDPNYFRARAFLHTTRCGFRDVPVAAGPDGSAFASAVNDHGLIHLQGHDTFAEPYRNVAWDAARPPC